MRESSLNLNSLLSGFSSSVEKIEDHRKKPEYSEYSVKDIMNTAFAMMYFQDPSLDHFQRRMQESSNRSNLQTMFGVENIPQQKRIRTFIDDVNPRVFSGAFTDVLKRIGSRLENFKFNDKYLCPIDASQYFISKSLNCKHCLEKKHRDGSKSYSHSVLLPMIVHPKMKQVIPLFPEEIRNEDGKKKQDCEINAAKRLIPKLKESYPGYPLVIMGDGLYAKQTFVELVLENGFDYMLVAKKDYNKGFMEEVERRRGSSRLESLKIEQGSKEYLYEWTSEVNLRKTGETLFANFLSLTIFDLKNEKISYENTWMTNLEISEFNAMEMVRAARSRWKVENEGFNTLKNQEYSMEHNYGHGENNLAFNFLLLTLLSHLYHQAHELDDPVYQTLKESKGTQKNFWDSIRSAIRHILFNSWQDLITYLTSPPREYIYDPISNSLIPKPS